MWWIYLLGALVLIYLIGVYFVYKGANNISRIFETVYLNHMNEGKDEDTALFEACMSIKQIKKSLRFFTETDIKRLLESFRPLNEFRRESIQFLLHILVKEGNVIVLHNPHLCMYVLTKHVKNAELKDRLEKLMQLTPNRLY